ncbi:MAG TPA: DNA repair protein RecO [Candidatus Binataceae bacterium]|nr:DNA repair protein RecO [Candidatus Binataceae bacterium]
MPAEESSPAIVLRARDYAEADRIVTLLTRDFGKLSGIAKGAKASRKRFERKLEPLSCVTLFFRRRPHGQLVFITRAEPGETLHPPLDDELTKLALGAYMVELADALMREEGEAARAFRVLEDALAAAGQGPPTLALRQAYELQMMEATGYGLDFARCRLCGNRVETLTGALYFVVARGGIVCGRCRPEAPEGAVRLEGQSALVLAHLAVTPLELIASATAAGRDGAAALNRFLMTILDRRLRSADFLDGVL